METNTCEKCEHCGHDLKRRNDIMERDRFEIYWDYYLTIEKMLVDTRQYLSPSQQNKNAYSDEFAKIILLACSEIDAILKFLCKLENISPSKKYYEMQDYSELLSYFSNIKDVGLGPAYCSSLKEKVPIVFPFKELDKGKPYANLNWWENYQKIKHNRMENIELGNLENALFSLAAYYIIICITMNYIDDDSGREYVMETHHSQYFVEAI